MMMVIITLKSAVRDFLQPPYCVPNCPQHLFIWPGPNSMQITCNTLNAHHVQYVVSPVVRWDSSAIKFDRAEIAIILASFYWPKRLIDEGGKETGVPGGNP